MLELNRSVLLLDVRRNSKWFSNGVRGFSTELDNGLGLRLDSRVEYPWLLTLFMYVSSSKADIAHNLLPRLLDDPVTGGQIDMLLALAKTHPQFSLFQSKGIGNTFSKQLHLSPLSETKLDYPPLILIECKSGNGTVIGAENQLVLGAVAWLRAIDQQLFAGRGLQRKKHQPGPSVS